jgi:hypothetical protein
MEQGPASPGSRSARQAVGTTSSRHDKQYARQAVRTTSSTQVEVEAVPHHPGCVVCTWAHRRRWGQCQVSGAPSQAVPVRRRHGEQLWPRRRRTAQPVKNNGRQRKGRAVHRWIARRRLHVIGPGRSPQFPSNERWFFGHAYAIPAPSGRPAGADMTNRHSCR